MKKFHVGCGNKSFGQDWHHVDGGNFPHLASQDVFLRDQKSNCADLIYASHLIAYFDRYEILDLLKEWHRVLTPGGIVRVATPDFDAMVSAMNHKFTLNDIHGPLYGRMEMNGKIIYHKTVYSFSHLKEVLHIAGFREVRRYNWKETIHGRRDDQSQAFLPKMDKENGILISLNVEAVK